MDPISAIGFAAALLNFIDFSSKLVRGSYELHSSSGDVTAENAHISNVLVDLQQVTDEIITIGDPQNSCSKELATLAGHCRDLSDELAGILDKLRVKEKDNKWQAVRSTWMAMAKQKSIASIEKRLGEYRSELMLRLNFLISSQNSSLAKQIQQLQDYNTATTGDQSAEIRKTLQILIEKLANNESTTILTEIRDGLSSLAASGHKIQQSQILGWLFFTSMNSRESSVEDAEPGTFEWILPELSKDDTQPLAELETAESSERLESQPLGSVSEEKSESHFQVEEDKISHRRHSAGINDRERALREHTSTNIQDFIQSSNGLYFICGKAGSGKSTLMKYIAGHEFLAQGLKQWAGDKKLILARFFFWNSGHKLQMSLEGFYRSVLFKVLEACPHLASHIVPPGWDSRFSNFEDHGSKSVSYNVQEPDLRYLKKMMSNLVDCDLSDCRLCLIIDGLDEYEGDGVDHIELAELLKLWATKDGVKVLCSARPHTEFIDTLAMPGRSTYLHELTWHAIHNYCLAKLSGSRAAEQDNMEDTLDKISTQMADMADGVFLWARLVTRSLLIGMTHNDSMKALKERLNNTPRDLHHLFEKILDSIDPEVRHRSDQVLSLAINNPLDQPLDAMLFSWLEDLDNPQFPYNQSYRGIGAHETGQHLSTVKRQLDALTRGLLEMKEVGSSRQRPKCPYWDCKVEFLHRTVKDFFNMKSNNTTKNPELPSDAYVRLILASMKFSLSGDCHPRTSYGMIQATMKPCSERLFKALDKLSETSAEWEHRDLERRVLKQVLEVLNLCKSVQATYGSLNSCETRFWTYGKCGDSHLSFTAPACDLNTVGWLSYEGRAWFALENLDDWATDSEELVKLQRQILRACTPGSTVYKKGNIGNIREQGKTRGEDEKIIKAILKTGLSIKYFSEEALHNNDFVASNHLLVIRYCFCQYMRQRSYWGKDQSVLGLYLETGHFRDIALLFYIGEWKGYDHEVTHPHEELFYADLGFALLHVGHEPAKQLHEKYFQQRPRSFLQGLTDSLMSYVTSPPVKPQPFGGKYRRATEADLKQLKLVCFGASDGYEDLVGPMTFRVY